MKVILDEKYQNESKKKYLTIIKVMDLILAQKQLMGY